MAAVSEQAKAHRREQARRYARDRYRTNKADVDAATARWRQSHPEHAVWVKMRQRCNNPDDKDFADYGGRGITICARWDTFSAFLADMGSRPTPKHQIERKRNHEGYTPANCIWATRFTQQRNTRQTCYITANGVTLARAEWADRTGIPNETIRGRLRRGWSPKAAVT
jgi:hypothetical protein